MFALAVERILRSYLGLSERGLVVGVLEEAAVGQRLEKGDQIGFLIVRDGEAGDQG